MGKAGSILGIIALILGATAIGLQGFNYLIINPRQKEQTWYAHEPDYYRCNPDNTFIPFNDLNITFEIKPGQSAYFLYNGWSHLDLDYDGFSILEIYYSIDGIRIDTPYFRERLWYKYSEIGGTSILKCASLQYLNSSLSAGTHNVSIILYANFDFNGVRESTLMVRTFYP
ncbi:MAG: hypothetical protein ACFE85_18335 [Candidatus Hodarchaeota archaeon]